MSDACIVYYHSCPWDGIPGRQRYLMEALSRHLPIIYIEEASDHPWRVTYDCPSSNVTRVRGLANNLVKFERRKWKIVPKLWCRWHLNWLRRKYRHVLFWNAENWLRPYRFIPHDRLVFDCIDPSFSENPADNASFTARENEILRSADVVFASSVALAEHCRGVHADVTLLNNACQPREYDAALLERAPRPPWWPTSDHPIAAYLGTIDERFDFAAMDTACRLNPGVHFILAGNVIPSLAGRVAQLKLLPNVTVTGRVSLEEGRYVLAHCAIGLIPFLAGPMSDAINPVKLYAYASSASRWLERK